MIKKIFKRISLSNYLFISMIGIIIVLSSLIFYQGKRIIEKDVFMRNQYFVKKQIKNMELYISQLQNQMISILRLVNRSSDFDLVRKTIKSDYLITIKSDDKYYKNVPIIKKIMKYGEWKGFSLYKNSYLSNVCMNKNKKIEVREIGTGKLLKSSIVIEVGRIIDKEKGIIAISGLILNNNNKIVDEIRNQIFEKSNYNGIPIGTVTIFQDGIRIATNVLNKIGKRAIGTKVSKIVYDNVIKKGKIWINRAFVVTNWYLTSYKPIKDIDNKIIGMLYVGILEKPLLDHSRKLLLNFMIIIFISVVFSIILTIFIRYRIQKSLKQLICVSENIGSGKFEDVDIKTKIIEFKILSEEINKMKTKLKNRDKNLNNSNLKLKALNKNYLDLISFVSHELKGILASTIMNAYTVKDGYLGLINFKQRRALDSIARNLDYLEATVKNFLDLSRIEKNEINVNKQNINLNELVNISFDSFKKAAESKNITLINNVDKKLLLSADADLFLIVINNLVSNAIKYGKANGKVEISCKETENELFINFYNDGVPIKAEDLKYLFKKFSRLKNVDKKIKGTGIGLFITSEIIKSHGGDIRVHPMESGNTFEIKLNKGGVEIETVTDNQKKAS